MPSDSPSISQLPSSQPSESPTASPSDVPTLSQQPSSVPSVQPTVSQAPSSDPSAIPTSMPSISPTQTPSQSPSDSPSSVPTTSPTGVPSASPSESTQPSEVPSSMPSESPSESIQPSDMPSPEFGDVNVTVPNRIEYVENGDFDISSFVDYVDRIPRSDEELFLEIDLTGAPDGTEIILNGVNLADDPNNFDGEWLLIPAAVDLTSLRIRNFEYFSGTFNLTVRGTLRENGLVVSNSTEEIVTAEVIPVATCIGRSVAVRVPEDAGNITWGADYFTDTSFRAEDYAQNSGNNIVPEFFIEIQITIPAPQLNITSPFDITVQDDLFRSVPSDPTSTTPGIGSATISLDETSGNKVYTIRSTLLPNGTIATEADILALTDLELAQLEDDLRSTASSLVLSISPEHTDADGSIIVGATTVDVNRFVRDGAGAVDISDPCTASNVLIVEAVADQPTIDILEPNPLAVLEDDEDIPLCFQISPSPDNTTVDNSEVLSVQISIPTVPEGYPLPVGTIKFNGILPDGVTITSNNEGNVYFIRADPPESDPESRAALLNSILCSSNLVFDPRFGYAGNDVLTVDAITTERENGDTAIAQGFITLNVTAVADVPIVTVKGNAIGLEDVSNRAGMEETCQVLF